MENKNLSTAEKALLMHKEWNGKLETTAKSKVNSREDLAIAYTPGVASPPWSRTASSWTSTASKSTAKRSTSVSKR